MLHYANDVRDGLRHIQMMQNAVGEDEVEITISEFHVFDAASPRLHPFTDTVTPCQSGGHGYHSLRNIQGVDLGPGKGEEHRRITLAAANIQDSLAPQVAELFQNIEVLQTGRGKHVLGRQLPRESCSAYRS